MLSVYSFVLTRQIGGFNNMFNLRGFVWNSRHLDPWRAWKGGSESRLLPPHPLDPLDPADPADPADRRNEFQIVHAAYMQQMQQMCSRMWLAGLFEGLRIGPGDGNGSVPGPY